MSQTAQLLPRGVRVTAKLAVAWLVPARPEGELALKALGQHDVVGEPRLTRWRARPSPGTAARTRPGSTGTGAAARRPRETSATPAKLICIQRRGLSDIWVLSKSCDGRNFSCETAVILRMLAQDGAPKDGVAQRKAGALFLGRAKG